MPEWTVSREQAGRKLASFLSDCLPPSFSQKKIKAALERNCCDVNGIKERFASRILFAGDRVDFDLDAAERLTVRRSEAIEQGRILFQDDDILVYNKPPGISSEALLVIFQKKEPTIALGHRLDRDTTGVIVLVRNEKARLQLIEQFRKLEVKKVYLAVVDGIPKGSKGVVDNELAKVGEKGGRPFWGSVARGKGQRAITEWQLVQKGRDASLLRCMPLTGRTHQIRVHLSENGHPILGDDLYGERFRCRYIPARCLLHAAEIQLKHPVTGAILSLQAPLPDDMVEAIERM